MRRGELQTSVSPSEKAHLPLQMFNKSIVPGLAKQLDPLNAALVADLSGSKAANDKEAELRKLLWVWSENLATLFWCLA